MGETREQLLARLAELNAAETESYESPENPDRFQTTNFGGATVTIEVAPFVMPESKPYSDPATFKIGTKDHRGWYRQALPYPRWPRPGFEATPEEMAANEAALSLWMESAQTLTHYLRHRPAKETAWQYAEGNGNLGQKLDQEWSWLTGVWQSCGMSVPSEEELVEMRNPKG
jgi:hypothetical protein